MALEPIPDPDFCPPIGSYFLSAGRTLIYRCDSAPLCRIYWDEGKATAWTTESAWYDTGCPKKGWRRNGPNFPSFLASSFCPDTYAIIGQPAYITLRHRPFWSNDIDEIKTIIKESRDKCLQNPVRPQPIVLPARMLMLL
jgi:hypothetical protein